MSDLTPEQGRRLQIAYHDTRCSSFCQDDVSTYPKVPDVLRGVVAQMLADERERIARGIEQTAVGVENDPEPCPIDHHSIARGLFWAARIARGGAA